jgi:hypothetical protein
MKTKGGFAMTNCTIDRIDLTSCKRRLVQAEFSGGDITSDGGGVILRELDRRLQLTSSIADRFQDKRRKKQIRHDYLSLLRQRVYGICLGYEDLNDHESLRNDPLIQTALGRDQVLASPSTLCRFENGMGRQEAVAIHEVLVERFIASHRSPPEELILDFDATDDAVHGRQEGRFFHGYYDHYCFLPLYVFCGEQLLVGYLRPSKIDAAKHAWAILSLLVKRLRKQWPEVRIIFRGDSGFSRWRMMRWCDRNGVGYIIGQAKNNRLNTLSARLHEQAEKEYLVSRQKQRRFGFIAYAAASWDKERRVIVKAEHSWQGGNPRYVVTNLEGDPQHLYEKVYCARGDMENRIKEQQLGLFADRTSCQRWWPNQFRLLLSGIAYVLLETLRRHCLKGTEFARSQVGTIRLRILKVGAVVIRNSRRIRMLLSSSYPQKKLFATIVARLALA